MTRLLFAAARKARLFYTAPEWTTEATLPKHRFHIGHIEDHADEYGIHPDDAHLAYGPISTALREFAETGNEPHTLYALMAMAAFEYERETDPFVFADERRHASMFALILAEAMADEGL